MTYTFVKRIDATDVTKELITEFRNKRIGVLVIENSDRATVKHFGDLVDQDPRGLTEALIANRPNELGEIFSSHPDMLWHHDGGYEPVVYPYVGLYCESAPTGSSPTYFLDMVAAYANSSEELKEDAAKQNCLNKAAKYFEHAEHPYEFTDQKKKRAFMMVKKAMHSLVQNDGDQYFFYSPAYTITELEPRLEKECLRKEYVYKHEWTPGDLILMNNLKVLHRRDETDPTINRVHYRYAFG